MSEESEQELRGNVAKTIATAPPSLLKRIAAKIKEIADRDDDIEPDEEETREIETWFGKVKVGPSGFDTH